MKAILLSALMIAGMAAAAAPLKTGDKAPDFSLKGADGKTYTLSQYKGKTVVLEWYNKDCPYVHKFYDSKTMQALQKSATDKGTIWLTIASSVPGKEGHLTEKEALPVMKQSGMASTALLLDFKADVARKYTAKTTPHMFVIDKKGLLAYQGAIDDQPTARPESLKTAHNYVTTAIDDVDKGIPVKEASTTPYGCSVKY